MKLHFRLQLLCVLIFVLPFPGSESANAASTFAEASAVFAVDLYKQLAQSSTGNLVVSPCSIYAALAMIHAGAKGETARELGQVLHLPDGPNGVHTNYGALITRLNEHVSPGYEIVLTNALFAQRQFPILKSYRDLLRDAYHVSLNEIDLTGWPNAFDPATAAAARRQINAWVARQTRQKIKAILPHSLPDKGTRLIIANAIFFKGKWALSFHKALTTEAPFRLSSGETVSVPMMHVTAHFRYAETDGFKVLALPYMSNRVSMILLLPLENWTLKDVEKALSFSSVEQLLQECRDEEVTVSLPRFELESQLDLQGPLRIMGMKLAFNTADADLSGMTVERPFFVRDVLHAAWVSVDEEGTVGAAGTAASAMMGFPTRFTANHPFLFLIRDNQTGVLLFLGRVVNPSKQRAGSNGSMPPAAQPQSEEWAPAG